MVSLGAFFSLCEKEKDVVRFFHAYVLFSYLSIGTQRWCKCWCTHRLSVPFKWGWGEGVLGVFRGSAGNECNFSNGTSTSQMV